MRKPLFLSTLLLVIVWSTAAIAQEVAAGAGIPSEILGAGQGISWPVACVAVVWIAARETRYFVDKMVVESTEWRKRKSAAIRACVELTDRREDQPPG